MVHPCGAAAQKSRLTDVSFWPVSASADRLEGGDLPPVGRKRVGEIRCK